LIPSIPTPHFNEIGGIFDHVPPYELGAASRSFDRRRGQGDIDSISGQFPDEGEGMSIGISRSQVMTASGSFGATNVSGHTMGTNNAALAGDVRNAMRQVVSSVAVITSQWGDVRNGLTATAVTSVTLEPPTLLVCINRNARAERLVADSGILSVSFLHGKHDELARAFSTSKLSSDQRFSLGTWTTLVTGAPVLADAAAAFDCRVEQRIEAGTHYIYICRVLAVTSRDDYALLYRDGTFRQLAAL
jgi:flavin reductase